MRENVRVTRHLHARVHFRVGRVEVGLNAKTTTAVVNDDPITVLTTGNPAVSSRIPGSSGLHGEIAVRSPVERGGRSAVVLEWGVSR